jgi:acetoin utilization deacetylase AcuC-like enzyme
MTGRMVDAAAALCGGRLVLVHEGGYSDFYVPMCGLATIDVLRGESSDLLNPYTETEDIPWQALQPHQEAVIGLVVEGPLGVLRKRLVRDDP